MSSNQDIKIIFIGGVAHGKRGIFTKEQLSQSGGAITLSDISFENNKEFLQNKEFYMYRRKALQIEKLLGRDDVVFCLNGMTEHECYDRLMSFLQEEEEAEESL